MNSDEYDELIAWAKAKGMQLHEHVERRCVDGIWGMYATQDIPKHSLLVSFPKAEVLPLRSDFDYPKGCPEKAKYQHAAAIEYLQGEESSWAPFLKALETKKDLESHSVFYFSERELATLKNLNPLLHFIVSERNEIVRSQARYLCEIDSELNFDIATTIGLNMRSRAWEPGGFLPIIDLFNHCDTHGAILCSGKSNFFHMTKRDYEAGEEVWVSYSRKDMYDLAIDFDFFDDRDSHFINFGLRGTQVAKTPIEKAVIKRASQFYKLKMQDAPDGIRYQLQDHGCYLMEDAPSSQLLKFLRDISISNEQEAKVGQASQASVEQKLNQVIDSLLSLNKVDEVDLSTLPEKTLRFYHMLKKEKRMLLNNKEWVARGSLSLTMIPPDVISQTGL